MDAGTAGAVRILVIEDQRDLVANLFDYFEAQGHALDAAPDGLTGLHLATVNDYDAIVLDLGLPGLDGAEVCRRLRRDAGKETPIVMLTARDTLGDKLDGFATGADDYLTKPFALPELEARVLALVRRHRHQLTSGAVLRVADLVYDTRTLRATRGGVRLELNPACRTLLALLMHEAPRVVSRERLERALWGETPPDADVLRSHIYTLRKVVDRPFAKPLIVTVPRAGYRIAADG